MKFLTALILVVVSMLVYIEMALAEMNRALFGIVRLFSSSMTMKEFFT